MLELPSKCEVEKVQMKTKGWRSNMRERSADAPERG